MTSLSRAYDAHGRLTHVMCQSCFDMVEVALLYLDDNGQKWDVCLRPECIKAVFGERP